MLSNCSLISTFLSVFHGRHACEPLEIFAEEARVGEVHVEGYLCSCLVAVLEGYLDGGEHGLVYPFLCALPAHAFHYGAHIAWCNAEFGGIEVEVVLAGGELVHQLDELIEHLLVARLSSALTTVALGIQSVHIEYARPQQTSVRW